MNLPYDEQWRSPTGSKKKLDDSFCGAANRLYIVYELIYRYNMADVLQQFGCVLVLRLSEVSQLVIDLINIFQITELVDEVSNVSMLRIVLL